VVQRALRERTNAEKKAERDARMQGVLLRARAEQQKLACDELARRFVGSTGDSCGCHRGEARAGAATRTLRGQ
jgi:hypothetical protein